MDKFNRNYILEVDYRLNFQKIRIGLPLTVEFDIQRNSFSSANTATIRVYNLNPNTREQIRKDQFDWDDQRNISFAAGYGDNLGFAFKGNIMSAFSVREGVNMITTIECYDAGFAYVNAVTGTSYQTGEPQKTVLMSLIDSLSSVGVSRGAIGNYSGFLTRGNSYSGNTCEVISTLTNDGFFIDNGVANALKDDECLAGDVLLINPKSGLLNTPTLQAQYINVDMLFEPGVRIGQLVKLESVTAGAFNGLHKVISIHHSGTISAAVSGSATTKLGLLQGTFTPVAVI